MRAWLFALAVLATLQLNTQVAGTKEVDSSISSSSSSSSSTQSNNSDKNSSRSSSNNNNNNNNNKNSNKIIDNSSNSHLDSETDNQIQKPDPATMVEIEKNLLSLFGFRKRPKIDRSKVVIPDAMKKLYAEINGYELDTVNLPRQGIDTKSANTVRSFTHEESTIDKKFLSHHRFRLYFNVSSIPNEEKIKAAELKLSRKEIKNLSNVRHHILVYDILRPGIKGKREPILLLIDSKSVRINSTDTVSIDVLPAVERWYKKPKENYGLLIHISESNKELNKIPKHEHIRLRRSISDSPDNWAQDQPLLFTYTDDGKYKQRTIREAVSTSNRPRRASPKKYRRKEICQRKPLYVDFTDVGWSDWIVAPPGYEAYYCQGDCPFPMADHLNTTNHAVVQTLVHSIDSSIVPKACCVPTHLTSMSMLYLDDQHKVVLKNYQDMTVVGCGCR